MFTEYEYVVVVILRTLETNNVHYQIGILDVIVLVAVLQETSVSIFGCTYTPLMSLALLFAAQSVDRLSTTQVEMVTNVRSYVKLKTWMSRSLGVIISAICLGSLIYVTQKLYTFTYLQGAIQFQLFHNFILQSTCLICGVMAGSVISRTYERFANEIKLTPRDSGSTQRMRRDEVLVFHAAIIDGAGLKSRAFTATYSILGNMLGIVITYTIACIQLKG